MSRFAIPLVIVLVYGAQYWVVPAIAAGVTIRRRLFGPSSGPDLPTYKQELETVADRWDSFFDSHNTLVTGICLAMLIISVIYLFR